MKNPYIIGIAGGSGAGKTFFLKALRNHFDEDALCIISQDNYYRPVEEQLPDENGFINFDRPEGVDHEGFLRDIDLLSKGQTVIMQEYMFNQPGVIGGQIELKPAPVIIVEGLFIFHFEDIRRLLDLKIFMDVPHETRLERRLKRDHKERGISEEIIRYQWENHVVPAYEKYLVPYKSEADMVVDNTGSIEEPVRILVDFIDKKITGPGV